MNCCKDCKERHINCHSECEKYKKWKREYDAKPEEQKKVDRRYASFFHG